MTTREIIAIGSSANDGTGDTLRSGATKMNNNMARLWNLLGGDSDIISDQIKFSGVSLVFEGSSIDGTATKLQPTDPTSNNIIKIPDASGNIVLDSSSQTLLNKTLDSATLSTPIIKSGSAFSYYVKPAGSLAANRDITLPTLTSADTFTFNVATQTLLNKTLDSATLNSPVIGSAIYDTNGAHLIDLTATSSAVNRVVVANAATGNKPSLQAAGTDSDIGLDIFAKNQSSVRFSRLARRLTTVTANGSVPVGYSHIDCNKGTALALTLANGVTSGEEIVFTNRGAGVATIIPSSFAHGTSFAISQNEGCTLSWNGVKWFITGNYSVVTIA